MLAKKLIIDIRQQLIADLATAKHDRIHIGICQHGIEIRRALLNTACITVGIRIEVRCTLDQKAKLFQSAQSLLHRFGTCDQTRGNDTDGIARLQAFRFDQIAHITPHR
jgi:hypothetical protein